MRKTTKENSGNRHKIWFLALPLLFFVAGYSGILEPVGKAATMLFKLYAEAEMVKLKATGFLNENGEPEYVVSLNSDELSGSGMAYLDSIEGINDIRETEYTDWYVIAVSETVSNLVPRLREAPQTKFVLPNRGLWLCH